MKDRRWPRVLLGYLVLPHAVPIVVVLSATAAFAVIAVDGWPGSGPLLRLLLAMLGGQIAVGVANDVVDAPVDARVKPAKPIPAGLVTVHGALRIGGLGLVAMALLAGTFGVWSLVLCAAGTAVGIAYSLWFKRTMFGWLPYLIALPLLPIWVFACFDAFDGRLLLLYPLGAFAVIAVYLAQSLPDVAADRRAGVGNVTARLGERRAMALCWATIGLTILFVVGSSSVVDIRSSGVVASVAAAGMLTTANVAAYLARPRLGVMTAFPCVAVSVVILGLGWVVSVTR